MRSIGFKQIREFLVRSFFLSLVISLPVYALARLIFFEVRLSFREDFSPLVKIILTGWLAVSIFNCVFHIIHKLSPQIRYTLMRFKFAPIRRQFIIVVLFLSVLIYACNGQSPIGVSKDLNTGLTTKYNGIKPGKTFLVMNEEVLNHNDIPIGESFQLINDQVEGLVEKDGKVSIGCALKITDKEGTVLLDNADLFKGKDLFEKKDARMLRCTINTGEPMEWEELYDVSVTFWDKYGKGKIENTVKIRMIDIP